MIHGGDGGKLFVGQNWMRYAQPVGVFCFGLQQVLLRADVAIQRHDDFFANGIDGRVGNLRKTLFEVVVQHPWLVRHYR